MAGSEKPFDREALEAMNEKTIKNSFFTPDAIYLDIGLFKDIPVGCIYTQTSPSADSHEAFDQAQKNVLTVVAEYQKRSYETIDPYLGAFGYTDDLVETVLAQQSQHDLIFILSPATYFLNTFMRHIVRNQNNSAPANKFMKRKVDADHFVKDPLAVTCWINTYPLTLSHRFLERLAETFGESLGVNIRFVNKDPMAFDQSDWDDWLKNIDCFYLDSLGRFSRSPFILKRQGDMDFVGKYIFARKRFEKCVIEIMKHEDFDQQVQIVTSQLDVFCDFAWLQNNDVRLTEEKDDVPFDVPSPQEEEKV